MFWPVTATLWVILATYPFTWIFFKDPLAISLSVAGGIIAGVVIYTIKHTKKSGVHYRKDRDGLLQ